MSTRAEYHHDYMVDLPSGEAALDYFDEVCAMEGIVYTGYAEEISDRKQVELVHFEDDSWLALCFTPDENDEIDEFLLKVGVAHRKH